MRARHRLSKMLIRPGVQFDDGRAWTQRHRTWLRTVCLQWPAAQTRLLDLEGVIDALVLVWCGAVTAPPWLGPGVDG